MRKVEYAHPKSDHWMICLNCEHEFSMEEIFVEAHELECPFCESREFRKSEAHGLSLDEYFQPSDY